MIEYKIKNKILYPLTQLIEREKEENKLIKGNISYIEDDVLEVNINKDLNISLNSIVEINRQKAFLIKDVYKRQVLLYVLHLMEVILHIILKMILLILWKMGMLVIF